VMVTHDPRAAAHATVVVQLEKGKLQATEHAGSGASRSSLPASR
jgi:ABC-type lipoprotein export system ATPase subunit